MDILDILLDILLKPPQPLMGLFFFSPLSTEGEYLQGRERGQGWWWSIYCEVQCIMGIGDMEPPFPLWIDTIENITFPQLRRRTVISTRVVKIDFCRTRLILMNCSGIKSIALSILSRCFIFYSIKVIL